MNFLHFAPVIITIDLMSKVKKVNFYLSSIISPHILNTKAGGGGRGIIAYSFYEVWFQPILGKKNSNNLEKLLKKYCFLKICVCLLGSQQQMIYRKKF